MQKIHKRFQEKQQQLFQYILGFRLQTLLGAIIIVSPVHWEPRRKLGDISIVTESGWMHQQKDSYIFNTRSTRRAQTSAKWCGCMR